MLYLGNFLVVFGIMMLSLCKEYWQVFLAQGVCMGLGAGLLYIPSLALVGIWFDKKRAVAMGVVMSGIAVGEFGSRTTEPYQFAKGGMHYELRMLIEDRWRSLHYDVRPSNDLRWLPLGHPCDGIRCTLRRRTLLPRSS